MNSNNIDATTGQNSTLIQISNNNVKYYEELAEQYAKSAEKYVSDCASYLSSAQRCITECQNVKESMTIDFNDILNVHTENRENPHEVTAEQVDTYTKTEIDDLLTNKIDLSDYYTSVEVDNKLTGYYTSSEVDDKVASDLSGYYTKEQTNDLISNVTVDLSDYYTKSETYSKSEVDEKLDNLAVGDVDLSDYYTKEQVDSKVTSDLSGYYTSSEIDEKLGDIETILDNIIG